MALEPWLVTSLSVCNITQSIFLPISIAVFARICRSYRAFEFGRIMRDMCSEDNRGFSSLTLVVSDVAFEEQLPCPIPSRQNLSPRCTPGLKRGCRVHMQAPHKATYKQLSASVLHGDAGRKRRIIHTYICQGPGEK